MATNTDWKRRALLAGGALAVFGWVKGVPYLASLGRPELNFEDIADAPPFRRFLGSGSATRAAAIFAGLDAGEAEADTNGRLKDVVRADPCSAFYGNQETDIVSVAVFSDFACSICRIMDDRLSDLEARDPNRFRIVLHQLPLLGVASETASRAVLAADLQGGYREMHKRLIRTPAVADEIYVAAIGENIGLDADRLVEDMASKAIDQRLRMTAAIADVFGFYGTPAFAIGRTFFMGSVPAHTLSRLIELEVSNPV